MKWVAAIAAAVLAACGPSSFDRGIDQGVELTLETSVRPPRAGAVKMIVHLTSAQGVPMVGARLKLEGDMSHPGMAPVFGGVTEGKAGYYESTLNLAMAGDWVIVVRGALADGQKIEREVGLPGVLPD